MRAPSLAALFSRAALTALVAAFATAGIVPAAASPLATPGIPRVVSRAEAETFVRTIMQQRAGGPAAFARMSSRRIPPKPAQHVKVSGWVVDNGGYLWGLDKKGAIQSYHSDCEVAGAGRVDHRGNLVVACSGGQEFNGIPGKVNIYTYGNSSAPADVVLTDGSGYFPVDAFEDNAGNVYVVNLFQVVCGPVSCNFHPGNVERWSVGNQLNGALPDRKYADANLGDFQSGDIDAHGTLYVSGSNMANGTPEVDAISDRVATNLNIPLAAAGDVYVVDPNGSRPMLSVIDSGHFQQPGGTLFRFAIPMAPGAAPVFIGTTPQNAESSCNPTGAGYSRGGADVLVAITNCQTIAYGREFGPPGRWKVDENDNFISAQIGLFVPSDK